MAVDLDYAKTMLENRPKSDSSKGDGIRWHRLPDNGSVKVRWLPPWIGGRIPGKIVYKHYNIPEIENITCFKTWNMECPLCEAIVPYSARLSVDDWTSSGRSYTNVLVLETKDVNGKVISSGDNINTSLPYILMANDYMFYWLLEQIISPDVGDISDPIKGHDVILRRKTHKGSLERTIVLQSRPIASTQDEIDAIINQCYDLDKIWRTPDEDYANMMKKSVGLLIGRIEERLLSLGSSSAGLIQSGIVAPDVGTTLGDGGQLPLKTKTNPAGSPPCYGTKIEDEKKCLICPWEFECQASRSAVPQS